MKYKTFKVYLRTLTPIHIGSGEEYEPVNYVIKNGRMFVLNMEKFNAFLIKRGNFSKFLEVCDKGGILAIRTFIFENFDESVAEKIIDVSNEYEKLYKENINSYTQNQQDILNQLAIQKTSISLFQAMPIIPGSSIKGAIRTAILNYFSRHKDKQRDKRIAHNTKNLEAYLLNFLEYDEDKDRYKFDVINDPLKFLKISDFSLIEGNTFVDIVSNIQSFNSDKENVPQYLELIKPNSIFEGTISIEENLNFSIFGVNEGSQISLQTLFDLCKQHYLDDVYEKEKRWFGLDSSAMPNFNSDYVLKLGMHTGAYAMTISNYRDITLKLGPNILEHQEHQTTVWKSNEYNMPLGWVELYEKFPSKDHLNKENVSTFKETNKMRPASEESKRKLIEKFGRR